MLPPWQVLFNMVPRSYTTACTPTTADAVKQSVIPPGVTTPAGVDPPTLVRNATCPRVLHHLMEFECYEVA